MPNQQHDEPNYDDAIAVHPNSSLPSYQALPIVTKLEGRVGGTPSVESHLRVGRAGPGEGSRAR